MNDPSISETSTIVRHSIRETKDISNENFHALNAGIVKQVSVYSNTNLLEIVIERSNANQIIHDCYSIKGFQPIIFPGMGIAQNQIIATRSSSITSDNWLQFMSTRGRVNEENQKRQDEINLMLKLPCINNTQLMPGDIVIQKMYNQKAELDEISSAYRFFHKKYANDDYSSRFTLHIMIIIDQNTIAHMNVPHCKTEKILKEEAYHYGHKPIAIIYRAKNKILAQSIVRAALQRCAPTTETPQKFLSGYSDAKANELQMLNYISNARMTKCIEHQIKFRLFKHNDEILFQPSNRNWCSKWIYEILKDAILKINCASLGINIEPLMQAEPDSISSKGMESILNKLCINGVLEVIGKSFIQHEIEFSDKTSEESCELQSREASTPRQT